MHPADHPGAGSDPGASAPILHGVTVIDLASWIAGPGAATVMGDFGAEVIKVEPPGRGDPYRRLPDAPGMPASEHDYSWHLVSRNKQSLALDLKVPAAREVLLALVRRADVLVTNFPPAVVRRLRVTYEELRPVNPRLVYAWLTGYGERGEEADKPGFDINAWWARSGLMDLVRAVGCPPSSSMPGMGDHPTAMSLFGAIMLALYRRERTGEGSRVSSSLMANGAWSNAIMIQAVLCGATFEERRPRERALNPLAVIYQCRDGRWLSLTILRPDKEWAPFTRAVGRPDLCSDPRFATIAARREHSPALVAILDGAFAQRDYAEWRQILSAHGVTFGPVARLDDMAGDRQMAAMDVIAEAGVGFPGGRAVMSPIQVDGVTKSSPGRGPDVGEHTDLVLGRLGYDAAAIARLREAGALG